MGSRTPSDDKDVVEPKPVAPGEFAPCSTLLLPGPARAPADVS